MNAYQVHVSMVENALTKLMVMNVSAPVDTEDLVVNMVMSFKCLLLMLF